jgi:hypothetical protein
MVHDLEALLRRSARNLETSERLIAQSKRLRSEARRRRPIRLRGSSDATTPDLPRRQRTAERASRGALPPGPGGALWVGKGSNKRCDGCGDVIHSTELEYEIETSPSAVAIFHVDCYYAWREHTPRAGDGHSPR